MTFWREVKEQLGDWFFSRELDDAHDRALRYGIEQATKTLSFQLEINKTKIKMTPTERKGYEKAQQVFADTRIRLASHTGADV
jgi:hypothetical protein